METSSGPRLEEAGSESQARVTQRRPDHTGVGCRQALLWTLPLLSVHQSHSALDPRPPEPFLTGFFSVLPQGLNSMFEVYLVGNNSQHFIISPTSVQGKADIRIRVAVPLDYETVDRYDFDVRPPQYFFAGWEGFKGGRGEHPLLKLPLLPLSSPPLWIRLQEAH